MSAPLRWTIRRLQAADAAAFQALRLAGFQGNPGEFRVAPEDEAGLTPQQVAERLQRAYVAGGWSGDRLVGIAGLTRYEGRKLDHRALLWGMYLAPEARGSGLAGALVDDVLAEARRQGLRQVLLTVAAPNARAIRLYETRGFVRYGVEPGAVRQPDGFMDEVLMVCHLDRPPAP